MLSSLEFANYFLEEGFGILVEVHLTAERLAGLLQRRARLDEQIATARRAESDAARKADARRKIIVGGVLLGAARRDPALRNLLAETLGRLLNERDRALFASGDEAAGDLVLPGAGTIVPDAPETAAGGWDERGFGS